MQKTTIRRVKLARETLRTLDASQLGEAGLRRALGGGSYPSTFLPDNCHTASCHSIC